jgi:hypothetical protein
MLMGFLRVSFGCREKLDTGASQDNWSIAHLPSPRQSSLGRLNLAHQP